MNANESFEELSNNFYKKFGYLPCGKDDMSRPSAETILFDLGETYSALLKVESTEKSHNKAIPKCLCGECKEVCIHNDK